MKNSLQLSIVLPAYLEQENLGMLLPRLFHTVNNFESNFEVLVIDTNTPLDSTKSICEQFGAKYINRVGGNTFGNAIRTGIAEAKGKYVIFMDSDGSHTPEFIKDLYEKRCENSVVIASRYIDGGFTDNHKTLVWMSRALNAIYSNVLRLKLKDVSNNFKLYDAKLLKNLELNCNNFDIVQEIIYKIIRHNKNVTLTEIPYSFKQRMFGHTKRNLIAFIFTFGSTLLRLLLSDLRIDLLLKYSVVAAIGLFFDFGSYLILLRSFEVHYFWSGVGSFCLGFVVNFSLGRKFVFKQHKKLSNFKKEMTSVLFISVVGL
ncbi:uncharacterized protein METZ01_LOCUS280134, partial [marine metagenome]